jgi:hypothetical protein
MKMRSSFRAPHSTERCKGTHFSPIYQIFPPLFEKNDKNKRASKLQLLDMFFARLQGISAYRANKNAVHPVHLTHPNLRFQAVSAW